MGEAAPEFEERHEFWKPARSASSPASAPASDHTCRRCGGNLIAAALFCHVCGATRESPEEESPWRRVLSACNLTSVRDALGQSTASLVALILGVLFMAAALLTGFLFAAVTALDWQAVQLWRIEWLLAAIASFTAGILLRKSRH